MARWKLTDKHYLNVEGTEWEYKETLDSGKQARKVFSVPTYLDPDSRSDWTEDGMIIVCDGKGRQPRDLIFSGPPTPDMLPLDEEAEAISAQYQHNWIPPIETMGLEMGVAPMAPTSSDDGFKELMMGMMKQNAELIALLANPAASERRV